MSNTPYDELCGKVDAFHDRVVGAHKDALTCHAGCSQCCHQHLSVVPLEWHRIAVAVDSLPTAAREALKTRVHRGRQDPRCPLLDDTGRCRVYAARPMICRTHGLPIRIGEPPRRDVCPLNFPTGPSLDKLDDTVILDVNRVNAMLGLMTQLSGEDPTDRVDLFDGLGALLETPASP